MCARFCFKHEVKQDEHFTGSFKSTDGEEYSVEMQSSLIYFESYPRVNNTLTIKWNKQSNKLIKVSLISWASKHVIRRTFLENEMSFMTSCNYDDLPECTVVVMIVVTPLLINEQPIAKPADEKLTPTKEAPIIEKKLEELSTDIKHFLQTGELSDVVLTDGSKEIRAHKLILSARSPVFARMFQQPMKENQKNKVIIEDVSHEVLLELLNFMYAGTVVIKDSSMTRDLYVAADKYDVKDLRDICSTILKSVNLNSVLDTLLLADLHSDQTLKEAALDFIFKNYSEMKATENWSSFRKEYPILAVEIVCFLVDKKM